MATIIYYQNLDYDLLPTAKKRARITPPDNLYTPPTSAQSSSYTHSDSQSNYSSTNTPNYSSTGPKPYKPPNGYPRPYNPPNDNSSSSNYTSSNGYSKPTPTGYQSFTTAFSNGFSKPYSSSSETECPTSYTPSPLKSAWNPNRAANYEPRFSPAIYKPVSYNLLLDTLKQYFNFESFRTNQREAVEATCMGLDTLILMPTGGGKSICYQLPAIVTKGVTIVVSPLKSLIEDQVNRLQSLNIRTSALYGETKEDDASDIYFDLNAQEPKHKLLYVTPEKIHASNALMNLFRNLHSRKLLARFVIDEAHCVSMWGSDFRPDYRRLGKLRDLFPDVPIMALTATAARKVRDDIFNQLKMNKCSGKTLLQSFNRPNLQFQVRVKSKGCLTEIGNLISKNFRKQCGIIYCLSRNDCETVAEKLREKSINSAPYHAGLSDVQRKKIFKAWSMGVFQVVCATIAFGMGIDKADVRFVIHYSVPKSVEGYYQEAGRAGRDGKFASCILYYTKSDLYRLRSMLSKGIGRKAEDKKRDQANLENIISYVENKNECRRTILLRYLDENFDSKDCISHRETACDNCLSNRSGKGGCDSYASSPYFD